MIKILLKSSSRPSRVTFPLIDNYLLQRSILSEKSFQPANNPIESLQFIFKLLQFHERKNEWDVGADDDDDDDVGDGDDGVDGDDDEDINKYVNDSFLLSTCSSSLLQRNPP